MKWSKKGLGIAVFGASAVLMLAGCSSGGGNAGGSGGGDSDEGYSIAFVPGVAGAEFYITLECGIKEAAEAAGATGSVQGPEKLDPTDGTTVVKGKSVAGDVDTRGRQ